MFKPKGKNKLSPILSITELIAAALALVSYSQEKGIALVEKLGTDKALFIKTDVANEENVATFRCRTDFAESFILI